MTKSPAVALVVGAGEATGGANARRFAREGYTACVTRRSADKLAPLVAQIEAALKMAVPITGLNYSGQYDFATTYMYWPTTHMVQPAANALQCDDCHGENSRLDWQALGYPGDPVEWGGRDQ